MRSFFSLASVSRSHGDMTADASTTTTTTTRGSTTMTTTTAPRATIDYDHGGDATVTFDDQPNVRYIVSHDEGANDPVKESGCPVELYVYRAGYHSASDQPEDDLSRIFNEFYTERADDAEQALEMTRRYARIFHDWTEEEATERIAIVSTLGQSPSDWADVFVAVTEDGYGTASSWAEEWAMWARGDVYVVGAEHYHPCESPEQCHGDEDSHWSRESDQGIESLYVGGIYADDAEDAAVYYRSQL